MVGGCICCYAFLLAIGKWKYSYYAIPTLDFGPSLRVRKLELLVEKRFLPHIADLHVANGDGDLRYRPYLSAHERLLDGYSPQRAYFLCVCALL